MISSAQNTAGMSAKPSPTNLVSDFFSEVGYPSGRKIVSCPNGDNQVAWMSAVKTLADCQNNITPTVAESYASGIQYTPHRAMSQLTRGNTRVENTLFNDRLQLLTKSVAQWFYMGNIRRRMAAPCRNGADFFAVVSDWVCGAETLAKMVRA